MEGDLPLLTLLISSSLPTCETTWAAGRLHHSPPGLLRQRSPPITAPPWWCSSPQAQLSPFLARASRGGREKVLGTIGG